jgi:hypothetical protein
MHPAYSDLEHYVLAADDETEQRLTVEQRARLALADLVTATTKAAPSCAVHVLRYGFGDHRGEDFVVAELSVDGRAITARLDRCGVRYWMRGTEVSADDLAQRCRADHRRWRRR